MTLKLTIQYSENKTAVAYVANDARLLVGNDIVEAKTAKAVSLLTKVEFKGDNMLHAMNNIIVSITNVEELDAVVCTYIDPNKVKTLNLPVIGVFLPKKEAPKENESNYKLYFALMQDCQ